MSTPMDDEHTYAYFVALIDEASRCEGFNEMRGELARLVEAAPLTESLEAEGNVLRRAYLTLLKKRHSTK